MSAEQALAFVLLAAATFLAGYNVGIYRLRSMEWRALRAERDAAHWKAMAEAMARLLEQQLQAKEEPDHSDPDWWKR